MKTLYFIKGHAPTPAERKEAEKMGAVFRSACAYHDGDFIETCDRVAGCYPEAYAKYAVPEPKPEPVKKPKNAPTPAEKD